ncbi:MAG: ABC transporter permease subunit, partial [Alphaproteobacteria bacterium]|nr:ABC transporter permease subunit [Alphaproteobacteria bacterium]
MLYGGRISLTVGILSVALGTTGATLVGIASGYFGGWVDLAIQRAVDSFMAFPGLVLLLLIIAIAGPGLDRVVLAISIFLVFAPSRVIRSSALTIRQREYVTAAQALGATDGRVLVRHILPNVFPVVIVLASMAIGQAILIEASLSFLGLGVPPPAISWGAMIGGSARTYFTEAPWMAFFPGAALALT